MTLPYNSRRSPVVCQNGTVASSQPLATQIGIDILKAGGNAADAAVATNDILKAGGNAADTAVAVAAALNVTEPYSTGIGGDVFCLFYDAKSKTVKGLNGSGRAPGKLTLDLLNKKGFNIDNGLPVQHGHSVTVPGAAAAWVDTVETFGSGKLTMSDILKPAIKLAEDGVPIQQIASRSWEKGHSYLTSELNTHGKCMLIDGKTPSHGDVIKLPLLAQTFKELSNHGKKGFYEGRIAQAIVDVIEKFGGVMTLDDLKNHTSTFVDPICVDYKGYRVWEIPPNSQGITALMAFNILENFDLKSMGVNSVEYLHTVTEAIKLSFADTIWYCADTSQVKVPVKQLLSKDYAKKRRELIKSDSVIKDLTKGDLDFGKDTVYFTTADSEGNACSFINSNFMGFGTAIVPEGCGFTLQNRGCNFSLDPSHPNCIAPNKRPYHTIIPAMVTSTDTGELKASYGVMGGFMQPQGHVQVLLNMLEFGMNPQEALDQPRICVGGGYSFDPNVVSVEDGISEDVVQGLRKLGHGIDGPVKGYSRSLFGRGQVITKGAWFKFGNTTTDLYWAGSDPRADGMAIGY